MRSNREQDTLSTPTDTVTPVSAIPIFYMHAGEHPFCKLPGCLCLANDKELEQLLRDIIAGRLLLRKVVTGAVKWEGNNGTQS
jgi:hypothetical protein